MRNVRALCGLAVLTAAVGCGGGSDQSGKGAQAPTTETPPPETQAQTPAPSETEMGPSATQPGQTAPGQPGEQMPPGQPSQQMPQGPSSNELLNGTLICMLGPMIMDTGAAGSMGQGTMGPSSGGPSSSGQGSSPHGSTGQGSSGQGSMGQGSSGQGSMGQGSSGQGSMGQGSTGQSPSGQGSMGSGSASSPADQCIMVAQAANVMPTSLALGEPSAVDSVRRALDSRLSVEGASQDASNNTLAFFDKGVAAAKEAQVADAALHGSSQGAVGGGPTSSGSGTSSSPSGASHSHDKKSTSSTSGATGQRAEDVRAHRALGDLYQFGRSMGATQTGTEAQALAWIIAVDRFEEVSALPPNLRSLAAEPLFAVILNVPPPTPTGGRTAATWPEYLSAAARSVGTSGSSGGAVGGGPSGTAEKKNMKDVARTAEERLQVLGQQLPPSSPLRSEVDRTVAHLRLIEAQASMPSTTQPSTGSGSQKKPPAQPKQPSQPKQPTQPK